MVTKSLQTQTPILPIQNSSTYKKSRKKCNVYLLQKLSFWRLAELTYLNKRCCGRISGKITFKTTTLNWKFDEKLTYLYILICFTLLSALRLRAYSVSLGEEGPWGLILSRKVPSVSISSRELARSRPIWPTNL